MTAAVLGVLRNECMPVHVLEFARLCDMSIRVETLSYTIARVWNATPGSCLSLRVPDGHGIWYTLAAGILAARRTATATRTTVTFLRNEDIARVCPGYS
jgi:hypothetical protein